MVVLAVFAIADAAENSLRIGAVAVSASNVNPQAFDQSRAPEGKRAQPADR